MGHPAHKSPILSSVRPDLLAPGSLVLVCLAIYANSLHNPLLRDDKTAVVNDPRAKDPSRWKDIFTQSYWHGLNDDPIYRPLTTLSFLLSHVMTGDRPWGYRIVNVILHAAVCVAVYLLGVRLLRDRLAAWIAAMLFAVHAVHTEAVTAIVGRADMGVTLLLVIMLWLLLGRTTPDDCRGWRWAGVLLLAVLALFVKETAFVVFPLVVGQQIWQERIERLRSKRAARRRGNPLKRWGLVASVGAACVGALALRYGLFGRLSRPGKFIPVMDNVLGGAEPIERVLTAIGLLGKYLGLLAWPHPLCCDYSHAQIPVARAVTDPPVLVGLAWLAGIGVAIWMIKRWASAEGGGVAVWCLGFLVITYSIISNAVLVIGTIFGERLIYAPSVAWCLGFGALAVGLGRRTGRWGRLGIASVCAAILVTNAILTVRRNTDWRDRLTLWTHDVRISPESNRCWSCLSKAYHAEGRLDEALEHMDRALAIYDGYWDDHRVRGELLAGKGRFEQAASAYYRSCELARGRLRIRPAVRLGQCYMKLDKPEMAAQAYQVALKYDPNHLLALNNLAYVLATSGPPVRDLNAAAEHIQHALELAPNGLTLLDTAVDVYVARGERDRAIRTIQHALTVGNRRHPLYKQLRKRLKKLTATAPATTSTTRP